MNLANTTDVNVLQERVDATDSNRYIQSKDRSGLLKLTGRKIVGGTIRISVSQDPLNSGLLLSFEK